MITIGAFEAKTHFSALLDRVAQGEEVVITRHGKPVARLVPEQAIDRERVGAAIARLKELAKGCRLDGLSVRALRDGCTPPRIIRCYAHARLGEGSDADDGGSR